jgi:hypothetical protein
MQATTKARGECGAQLSSGKAASLFCLKWYQAAIIMVAALVVMFHPIIFGGKTTSLSANGCSSIMPNGAYSDRMIVGQCGQRTKDPVAPAAQSDPYLMIIKNALLGEHKLPLWNVYAGCGMPFLANMQSQLFCPLVLLASLFASMWAIDIFVLARLLVGGLVTFLALACLLPERCRSAALVGGAGFMFSGYFLHSLNLPEMSVSVLVPALLLGVEVVLRKEGVSSFALCAAIVAAILFGGMPEVSFNALAFSGFYVLVRLLTIEGWKSRLRALGLIAAAYIAGLTIALPQVLPFLEYVRASYNLHDPAITGVYSGLLGEFDWRRGFFSYVFPHCWSDKCFARGFYGVSLSFLAFLGLSVASWRLFKVKAERAMSVIIVFHALMFLAMVLKRFGHPLVQWYGELPLANLIYYYKYNEPLMALCIAVLASAGVAYLQLGRVRARSVLLSAVGFWIMVGWLYLMYQGGPMIAGFDLPRSLSYNLRIGLLSFAATAALCLFSVKSQRFRTVLPFLLLLPFCFETYNVFLKQAFYANGGVAPRYLDPFKGAPYIDFLKAKMDRNSRIMAFDGVLNPNWAAVFAILDVRAYDALYPACYTELVGKFFPQLRARYWAYEYHPDRFTGAENSMHPPLADLKRLCVLTSTKYIVSQPPLESRTDLIQFNEPMDASCGQEDGFIYSPWAKIDGAMQPTMFQHPRRRLSSSAVKFTISVPEQQPILHFDFVRSPDIACPARRTPVEGIIFINSCEDRSSQFKFVFRNEDPLYLHAEHYNVDLTKFSGKDVIVTLASRPLSGEECSWEWVGWKSMRFSENIGARRIYDKEVKVYELPGILPHASVFSAATLLESDQACLDLIKSNNFEPLKRVAFVMKDVPVPLRQQLSSMHSDVACRSADMVSYKSDNVEIALPSISSPAILLLTDIFYPGWHAYVDGKEAQIVRANYCFRAVLLPAGARNVTFRYDPLSFKLGLIASAIALFLIGLWAVRARVLRLLKRLSSAAIQI